MDKVEQVKSATPIALAKAINKAFPEYGDRILPVSEADINKTNVPKTFPIGFVALLRAPMTHSEKSNKDPSITEEIVVEFWFKSNKYVYDNKTESPFWAFYDYSKLRDKFIAFALNWKSPEGYRLKLINMEVDSTELAVMISFRVDHIFDWCPPQEILEELDLYDRGEARLEFLAKMKSDTECCVPDCLEKEENKCL